MRVLLLFSADLPVERDLPRTLFGVAMGEEPRLEGDSVRRGAGAPPLSSEGKALAAIAAAILAGPPGWPMEMSA